MNIRKVEVSNFRGIRELEWCVDGNFVCLIGAGDSTKSTLLDAIERTLSPRWNVVFDDADFYSGDTTQPIEITVTVGDLPEELLKDNKFGLDTRGWNEAVGLKDEPEDADSLVLSIRLKVDSSLEPLWAVINDRLPPEGKQISASNRELLGVGRLGGFVDRHLSWSKGSILYRLTGKAEEMSATLLEAGRTARLSLDPRDLPTLNQIAERAQVLAAQVGVAPKQEYRPKLDVKSFSIGEGGITLHDGNVPLRRAGLGTRRLLSLALKREAAKLGGVTLIDEVEHGLEPHRIRRLLHFLKSGGGKTGQALMSTHSPVVLTELSATDLRIVRSNEGKTEVLTVGEELQALIRKAPDALLGKKVLVCEGRTELGIVRLLDRYWADNGNMSFAYQGVVPVEGGGTEAPSLAVEIAKLGYQTAFLGDSDVPLAPTSREMQVQGIQVFLWDDDIDVEHRLLRDLPWLGVLDLIRLAVDTRGEESVRSKIAHSFGVQPAELSEDINEWADTPVLREAIANAAGGKSKKAWFKNIEMGEEVGRVITEYLGEIQITDLCRKISAVREWVDQT